MHQGVPSLSGEIGPKTELTIPGLKDTLPLFLDLAPPRWTGTERVAATPRAAEVL